ncbi:MAG: SPOR domain-containing protein [Sphingomonadaceae bacterium]|nr:SPOR domain-containing protein [Sphingomonadaceae bacterium]
MSRETGQDNHEHELEVGDEDRLPWLEAVEEDEDGGGGPSVAKLIAAIVIGLVAIGVIVGGLFWLGNRNQQGGNGEIIAAPEGDYKVRPENPGGMNVSGEGEVAAAASAGATPQGNLALNAPETPVTQAPRPAAPAPAAPGPTAQAPAPQPARPAPAPAPAPQRPAPAPQQPAAAGPGGTIQLGAFSSQAAAGQAWGNLSGRFRYLAPLNHSVVPVQAGGRTLYRLRASGAGAADVCRRLQVAGEACSTVG